MKFTILLLVLHGMVLSQINPGLYRPLQKTLDITLTANSFHTAEVSDNFQFEILGNFSQVKLDAPLNTLKFGTSKFDIIEFKTLHAFVDLPFNLQVGFHFNYPKAKINGFNTNYSGYSLKYQFNHLIWDKLPPLSLQIGHYRLELSDQIKNSSSVISLQMSKEFLSFEPYAGILYSQNDIAINGGYTNIQNEVLYKVGLSKELFVFNIYAETTFHIYKNFSAGISLKF